MNVRVQLYLDFTKYAPGGEAGFELVSSEGAAVARVLETLGIPPDTKKITLVNGRKAEPETILMPDDLLVVFPPLEGG